MNTPVKTPNSPLSCHPCVPRHGGHSARRCRECTSLVLSYVRASLRFHEGSASSSECDPCSPYGPTARGNDAGCQGSPQLTLPWRLCVCFRLVVAHVTHSIGDLQGPRAGRIFSPCVNRHEVPVSEAIRRRVPLSLSQQHCSRP